MSVNFILKLTAKPDQLDALTNWFTAAFPVTRTFDGCEELNLFKVADETDALMIVEQWQSQESYDKYFSWREENGTLNEMLGLLARPIEVVRIQRVPA